MNLLRLTLIAFSLALLVLVAACGGGGSSGGTAATRMPTPTNMPDPMTPPPVTLPGYAIPNIETAQTRVGGTVPTSMSETQIVSAIQSRAGAADTFEFSDFSGMPDVDITCTNNSSCSGSVDDVGMLTFSLAGIDDLSLVVETGLMDFVSNTQAVMVDEGVTMIQSQAAAGQEDGTRLSFQTYGGWLTNTVFGLERLDVLEDGETTTRYASFNFGNDSGSNPTGGAVLQWAGVMVGTNTRTGDIIQGDAGVQYETAHPDITVIFENVKNLNDGSEVTFGLLSALSITRIPLTNGRFESTSGDFVKGSFYGSSYEEVGGIFNSSTHNIIGAFAGTKQ